MSKNVLDYCEEISKIDTEHIEQARENLRFLREGRFNELNGCPENFGAKEFTGFCEIKEVPQNEQGQQCIDCWKAAMQA